MNHYLTERLLKEKWFPIHRPTNDELEAAKRQNDIIDSAIDFIEYSKDKMNERALYFFFDMHASRLSDDGADGILKSCLLKIMEKL